MSDPSRPDARRAPLLGSTDDATDFGRVVRRVPAVVHEPADAGRSADVLSAVPDGVDLRYRAGAHSVDGQTLTSGHVISTRHLTRVDAPVVSETSGHVDVEAGATWRTVIATTSAVGMLPPVVVDHLDLTVGGTLSMGGISGTSHLFGTQTDHVLSALVVTRGGHATVVRPRDPEFGSVMGRQGQGGLLLRARLRLVPAPRQVDVVRLGSGNLDAMLSLQADAVRRGTAVHVDGQGRRTPERSWRWSSTLAAAHGTAVADRLSRLPGASVETWPVEDFLDRAGPILRQDYRAGTWHTHAHPRTQVIVPLDAGRHLVGRWSEDADGLTGLGTHGSVLTYVTRASRLRSLGLGACDGDLAVVVGWQRTVDPASPADLTSAHAHARRMRDDAVRAGGIVYAGRPAAPPPAPPGRQVDS